VAGTKQGIDVPQRESRAAQPRDGTTKMRNSARKAAATSDARALHEYVERHEARSSPQCGTKYPVNSYMPSMGG